MNNRGYYSPFNILTNPGGYYDQESRNLREFQLMKGTMHFPDSWIPDNISLDSNGDFLADALTFVFRGEPDAWGDLLWPMHQPWQDLIGTINGAAVNHYVKLFEGGLDAGVICHESGHNIGFPDLYHYSDDGLNPVGDWDVMASSNTQHELTYAKWKYGNWFDTIPTITPTSVSVQYTLTAIDQNPYACYKIQSNITDQFYMLEYRRQSGRYEIGVPSTGLIVYRIIDQFLFGNIDGNASGPPDEMYVYRPGGDIDSDGDITSASFSATAGRIEFNNNTDPQPWLHGFPDIQLEGNLVIHDIGISGGNTITFRVRNSILTDFVWDGSTSIDWWEASNWSRNIVPDLNSNVIIPYGVPNYPKCESTRAVNNLHIEPGASITLGAGTLQVNGNFENQETLIINHTDANLVVEGDMFFRSGSTANITNSGALMVMHGSLLMDIGSNVQMVRGTIQFEAAGNAYLYVNAPSAIGNLIVYKASPDRLYLSSTNASNLTINGSLTINNNRYMTITSAGMVSITSSFNNPGGYFTCTAGTVSFEGITVATINNHVIGTSYFNNLKIAKTNNTVTLATPIEVMGNLTIAESAAFNCAGFAPTIHQI